MANDTDIDLAYHNIQWLLMGQKCCLRYSVLNWPSKKKTMKKGMHIPTYMQKLPSIEINYPEKQ